MRDDGPPPEAYGRVTNPERFLVVRDAAEAVVDQLSRRTGVSRHDLEPDPDAARRGVERIVELHPASGAAAPIRVSFTGFPGAHVRVGRWHEESFPACGCDACDEAPDDAIQKMRQLVDAVLAGRFAERVKGRWRTTELSGPGWTSTYRTRLERRPFRRHAAGVDWAAWDDPEPLGPKDH